MRCPAFGMVLAAAFLRAAVAAAQPTSPSYPDKQVTIVVPISAGSTTDVLSRILAEKLQRIWKHTVIVENRPGIAGTLRVAQSDADGYTVLMTSNGHAVLSAINNSLPFDPLNDFVGVAQVASTPFVLVVTPSLPARSVKELIELARSKPGTLNIAIPGLGTAASIASELFLQEAGVDIVRVPFKGGPEALNAVLRGDTHIFFATASVGASMIKAGQVRALAVTTPSRLTAMPDVPTLVEAGLQKFSYDAWLGVLVRSTTDQAVVRKLASDILAVAAMPEFGKRLDQQGLDLETRDTDAFHAIIRQDTARFGPLLKQSSTDAK